MVYTVVFLKYVRVVALVAVKDKEPVNTSTLYISKLIKVFNV